MDFRALAAARYSVRAFRRDPVPEELLEEVLETVAAFDPAAAREVLALPDGIVPVAFTPLGWPADAPRPKERRPLSELVIRKGEAANGA
ncbi:MAG: nitroreductase family protein [Thermoanaerobaculia bacterium]|nr:nitroreductase family protein [Thermoanaerobaculia bacterium]